MSFLKNSYFRVADLLGFFLYVAFLFFVSQALRPDTATTSWLAKELLAIFVGSFAVAIYCDRTIRGKPSFLLSLGGCLGIFLGGVVGASLFSLVTHVSPQHVLNTAKYFVLYGSGVVVIYAAIYSVLRRLF